MRSAGDSRPGDHARQLRCSQRSGVDTEVLAVIWDADFFYGKTPGDGESRYVLCEINASSTIAFPEHAMPTVAASAVNRIRAHKLSGTA